MTFDILLQRQSTRASEAGETATVCRDRTDAGQETVQGLMMHLYL